MKQKLRALAMAGALAGAMGGAATVAAALRADARFEPTVVAIVSGGNLDPSDVAKYLNVGP